MNALQLTLATRYGNHSPSEIHAGVVGALALTVYVKYRNSNEEMRRHFFDVLKNLDEFLFNLNEVRAFDVDRAKLLSYESFKVRYNDTIHPTADLLLDPQSNFRQTYLGSVTDLPSKELLSKLLSDFKHILQESYKTNPGQGGE